jgi:hypothetical protein
LRADFVGRRVRFELAMARVLQCDGWRMCAPATCYV